MINLSLEGNTLGNHSHFEKHRPTNFLDQYSVDTRSMSRISCISQYSVIVQTQDEVRLQYKRWPKLKPDSGPTQMSPYRNNNAKQVRRGQYSYT